MSGFLCVLFILGISRPTTVITEVCGCVTIVDEAVMDVSLEDYDI